LSPPQGWRHFDQKLNHLVATSGKQSFSSRFFGSLGRFLPSSHRLATPRWSPALLRGAMAIALLVVIISVVLLLTREATVSASQLLANSIQAEELQTRSTKDPVV